MIKTMDAPTVGAKISEVRPGAPEWATEIIRYLDANNLPVEKWEERNTLVDGVLYRWGYSTPLLRCLSLEEAQYILTEIHEGVCSNHSSRKALAGKVVRVGYYWPHTLKDAKEFIRKCQKCQEYAPIPHYPLEEMTSIVSPWPFALWGVDLVSPLPPGK